MSKSYRGKKWYDEPRLKEVRKGVNKSQKHRKNLYKYSSDQPDNEHIDDDRDEYYDTQRKH